MNDPVTTGTVRLDAWLWAIRLYKTRSAATTACRAGHVRVPGQPAKPAPPLAVGAKVRVRQHGFDRILVVRGLLFARVGAAVAATCYDDLTLEIIPQVPVRGRGAGRPTKKDRRAMERLRRTCES